MRDQQRGAEHRQVAGAVVESGAGADHQDPEADDRDRDPAVEAAGLGVRPGIERAGDLAARVGVGAVALARAGVADVGAGPVAGEPLSHVGLDPVQALALRALPGVEVLEDR